MAVKKASVKDLAEKAAAAKKAPAKVEEKVADTKVVEEKKAEPAQAEKKTSDNSAQKKAAGIKENPIKAEANEVKDNIATSVRPGVSYEEMTVEELQYCIIEKMKKNGPVTDQMRKTVVENVYHDSLVNWVKSFR